MLSTLPPVSAAQPSAQTTATPGADANANPHAFARQLQAAQDTDPGPDAAKPAKARDVTPSARPSKPATASPSRPGAAESASGAAAHATGPSHGSGEARASDNGLDCADSAEPTEPDTLPDANSDLQPQDLAALLAQLRNQSPAAASARLASAPGAEEDTENRTGKASRAVHGHRPDAAALADATATGDTHGTTRRGPLQDAAGGAVSSPLTPEAQRSLQEPLAGAAATGRLADAEAYRPQAPVGGDTSSFSAALASATAWAGAASAAGSTDTASGAAQAQAQRPAPPDSPDFGPQLGAQISTFVRDGVEHAQLHLNPADLGPVTVQIQLDGQSAQVHLVADQAATRQALEQAMPQLAGSLREAGVTLTGGGVFQQPRQSGGDASADSRDSSRSKGRTTGGVGTVESAVDKAARAAAQPRRRGVVDLVA